MAGRRVTVPALAIALVAAGAVVAMPAAAAPGASGTATAGAAGSARPGPRRPSSTLSPRLAALAQPALRSASPEQRAKALSLPVTGGGSLRQPTADTVMVEVRPSVSTGQATAAVRAAGGTVVHVSDRYTVVTAAMPLGALGALGASDAVAYVEEVLTPETGATAAGSSAAARALGAVTPAPCGTTTSEGDTQLKALDARAANNVDGTGVKVGILSDSFNKGTGLATNAAADVAAGNLPGPGNPCGRTTPVNVVEDLASTGADEGRAMLQIVHDLAPGSALSFATAFNGLTSFADNVRALRAAGADIIADDVFYFAEPFFQPGPVDVAIDDVTALGGRYFTLAGNHNRIVGGNDVGTWEAPAYRAAPLAQCPAPVQALGDTLRPMDCLDFDPGPGVDTARNFTLTNGASIRLNTQWAEPWNGVVTDLDVWIVDTATNAIVSTSNAANFAVNSAATSQKPFEFLEYQNLTGTTRTFAIVIGRYDYKAGGGTPRVKTMFLQGTSFPPALSNVEYPTSAGGDIVGPSIYGHSGSATATVVGAVPYNDSATPETYTSRGPMTTYFGPVRDVPPSSLPSPPAAAPTPASVRNKPDVAATDGGANSFFGGFSNGAYRFFGTSAATPHAAAVGALMLQKNPTLTAAQMRSVMVATAAPVANGTPASVGGGLVNALAAVGTVGSAPPAPVISAATPGNGQVTLTFTAPGAWVTSTQASCTSTDGGTPGAASGPSPLVVGGLTNGRTYSCKVVSGNPVGSTPSAPVGVVLPDLVAPVLATRALPATVLAVPRLTWTASDDIGVASFRVRQRSAPNGGRLGAWVSKPSLPGTARSYLPAGVRPGGFCVEITALDSDGNASPPSVRCSSLALDDRAFAASRGGWVRPTVRTAYLRTLSSSTRAGAFLARGGVYGTGLTLVVNKAPGAGTLGVYVKNRLVGTVNLSARRAALRQLVPVRTGRMSNATVVVRVLTPGRGVAVDGVAVAP